MVKHLFKRRTLIIGSGLIGHSVVRLIKKYGQDKYQIVGFVDGSQGGEGPVRKNVNSGTSEYGVLGAYHDLLQLISKHRVSVIILENNLEVGPELLRILGDSLELGARIVPGSFLYEQLTGRISIANLGNTWQEALPIRHPGTAAFNRVVKRVSDILLASIGIVCSTPVFPLIVLAIYLDSPGPIFYTQERVGKSGRVYKLYKFRSMVPNAEKGKAVWARGNDKRVTRVGRFLRKTHIDEFPQFVNILKGEMSAVGPRSERPEFVIDLAREIPFYRVRHAVKPGMAGWGLLKQGYGASTEDAKVKLEYDLYYIKHQSLWLDMVILFKTIIDSVTLRGR